ncbi:PAS domain-containing protein [Hydrogenophaga sp. YM1]|uniref:PAS domain-containing sensor histidine kinase n=1 Tax=Hydrogenophaga sp. YM1 TaxID=2806262 RepID=UPI0019566A43|nr:PAS domain-containing protein [Hydrogenophaga sp. YM1]QRR35064.1 PAS domain-containing protein [Hydrogenophaga sp. YM1]
MIGQAGRWMPQGRWLVPLLLALVALLTAGTKYVVGMRQVEAEVTEAETRRLRERLTVEQSRLNLQADPSSLPFARGVVGGLGLYKGMRAAWLLRPDGQVQASLTRADVGRDFTEVAAARPELLYLDTLPRGALDPLAIVPRYWVGGQELVGAVPLSNGRRLVVLVDITVPMAQRHAALREAMLRETLLLLALAGALGLVLHFAWFRRAEHLARSLTDMGEGRLQARAGLQGFDELALIGAAADRMAERLESDQARLQHLHALVDRSPVVVIEWANQPGWPMTYLSRAVAQWGYEAQDLLSGTIDWDDLVHPDDVERMNTEIAAHWAAGRHEYRQEYRLRRADGVYAWIDDRTSITRRPDGEIDSISGILLDITAQKEAQLALREQSEVQRLFYELPFIGMAISDPDSKRWLQVNDRLCEILGRPREEVLRMSWAEMTPQPDRERNIERFEALRAGHIDSYQLQKRFVRGDGGIVHVELDVRPLRLADGRLHRLFATIQDVTGRLRASEALNEQKGLLEQAEGLAGLGSWRFDMADGRVWWSEQMFRNIGRDPALGPLPTLDAYLDCMHPEDRDRVRSFMQSPAEGDGVAHTEFRRHPGLGEERWFRASVARHRAPEGSGWRYSGTLLDITALKRAQLDLQRTNAELEHRVRERTEQLSAANRELEAFTYTVSHDLKAPLRGIDGYSQLLEEEAGQRLNEEERGFVRRIRRGVQQMSELINDLLDYSRMERRAMDPQPLDLEATVRRVLDEFGADIERSRAEVRLALPPLSLRLDREGMAVVLRNLVGNALKFARAGQPPRIELGASPVEGGHRLWVRDHGVGFDMKYHDRIFGIFQRLQRAEDYPGTGVGLALVAKAVQRMGGRVWAESVPGQGTTFFLEFPA